LSVNGKLDSTVIGQALGVNPIRSLTSMIGGFAWSITSLLGSSRKIHDVASPVNATSGTGIPVPTVSLVFPVHQTAFCD
jgi:hypothetical protein